MRATNNQPRISAVITAYNCAAFISDAIESVLGQSEPVDEIIVVDDGSSDETPLVVTSYASAGVRYVRQDNQGAGAARNRGIREATGEFLAFLDGDDIWLPNKIALQRAHLDEHPETLMVSGHKWWWDVRRDKRWIKRYGTRTQQNLARELLIHNDVGNPSMVLLRREVLEKTGPFDPTLRWGQDWELWIRIAAQGRIDFVDQPVIVYRWHPQNLSHQRKLERIACFHGISRRAIHRYAPPWMRPLLLARAWSLAEFHRARHMRELDFPRWQTLRHAAQALAGYPFENPFGKAKLLLRTIVGEIAYDMIRTYVSYGT